MKKTLTFRLVPLQLSLPSSSSVLRIKFLNHQTKLSKIFVLFSARMLSRHPHSRIPAKSPMALSPFRRLVQEAPRPAKTTRKNQKFQSLSKSRVDRHCLAVELVLLLTSFPSNLEVDSLTLFRTCGSLWLEVYLVHSSQVGSHFILER